MRINSISSCVRFKWDESRILSGVQYMEAIFHKNLKGSCKTKLTDSVNKSYTYMGYFLPKIENLVKLMKLLQRKLMLSYLHYVNDIIVIKGPIPRPRWPQF